MAQIVVYGHAGVLRPRIRELSDAIHSAAVTAFALPASKRFHRFVPLDRDCFLAPPDRTADYTIIEVSMFEGRSVEAKKLFIGALYRDLGPRAAGRGRRDHHHRDPARELGHPRTAG